MLGRQGGLLIGIDLQKDVSVIEAAYNDADGVTANFNLNLLPRVNSELDSDFDLERFEHKAIYNADEHRVEMSILSLCDQQVWIGNRMIEFSRGISERVKRSSASFPINTRSTDSRDSRRSSASRCTSAGRTTLAAFGEGALLEIVDHSR